jgi:hypothetical protein
MEAEAERAAALGGSAAPKHRSLVVNCPKRSYARAKAYPVSTCLGGPAAAADPGCADVDGIGSGARTAGLKRV